MSKIPTDLQWADLASRLKAKAAKADVPTKTSDLTNDSGFLTSVPIASASTLGGIKVGSNLNIDANGVLSATAQAQVQANWTESDSSSAAYIKNKPTLAAVATSGSYTDLSNKPTIDTAVTAGSANAVSGGAVSTAIANAIAGVTQFDYQVVASLPATGSKGVIYLVANSGSGQNIYDEYIWLSDSSKYEKIGTTDIDLTNYVQKTDYATSTDAGVVKVGSGLVASSGTLSVRVGDGLSVVTDQSGKYESVAVNTFTELEWNALFDDADGA